MHHVFVDTSEFERLSYAFTSGLLKNLTDHNQIQLVLSEVVVSEIRDHLKKAASESVRLHKSFSDKARILRNLRGDQFPNLFEHFTQESLEVEFDRAFREFLNDNSVTVIPIAKVDLNEVFRAYCESRPPFESGRKKSEFPDAFALDSARHWASENKTILYVISCDNGMKKYCDAADDLIHFEGIGQFLNMLVQQYEDAEHVENLLELQSDFLEERVAQDFAQMGFYIDDREGEVEDVTVTDATIEWLSIIEICDLAVTLELEVMVGFVANVSYDDIEHGIYDSETKSLWAPRINSEWERETSVSVLSKIQLDSMNPESFSIEELVINNREDVGVSFDDSWP